MAKIDLRLQDIHLKTLDMKPIHISGQIQPHGIIFVLEEPNLKILQVSNNASSIFGISPEKIVQKNLDELLDPFQVDHLRVGILFNENLDLINPAKVWSRTKGEKYVVFDSIFHRNSAGFLILELEPAISQENIPFLAFYHLARASITQLEKTANLRDFCQTIVTEVRKVSGFDRVMLYKFHEDGHGSVMAEDKLESLEPYLGLHYPESDIPKPARKLFCSNWIRLIPNTHADPVQLFPTNNPNSEHPLDLTNSILRSASPCHLEYLHNMGVGASLTISLMKEDKLWGLIACHHQSPKYVSYELRKACEFLGRMIFSEISAKEETEDFDRRIQLTSIHSALIERMSQEENLVDGLVKNQANLLELLDAQGAAVCFGNSCQLIGETPKEEEVNLLLQWLQKNFEGEVFYTDSLSEIYPNAEIFKHVTSGLLAIPIAKKNFVLWFRSEVIQTVNWGGDPNHAFTVSQTESGVHLSPRKSFEVWKETVRLKSLPWKQVEIQAALELRKAIINIVLSQAEELAQLAHDLERSNAELKKFAYVASHDLQEPLNQVSNYVQLLQMRYLEQLDEDAVEFINFAVEGVTLMQTLIDDVLTYSQVDMLGNEFELIDVEKAFNQALNNLERRILECEAVITHEALPNVIASSTQLMQLFQNLLGNAIKFRSGRRPCIHVGVSWLEDAWLFSVQDNGIGIEEQFSDRIFVIFQRLHTRDEYPGTGIGLTICKKIVECHRGRIWVESGLGRGATFYFTIPVGGRDHERRNSRKAQNNLFS